MESKKNHEFDELTSKFSQLYANIKPSNQKKKDLKIEIFNRRFGALVEDNILEKSRKVFYSVVPGKIWVCRMRELILEKLHVNRPWYLFKFPFFRRTVLSYVILIAFTFSIFGTLTLKTSEEVYAKESILYIDSGTVEVRRDGQSINAENGFYVRQGDAVKTFDTSNVFIKYADGNETDIAPKSLVYLKTLDINQSDFSDSNIALELKKGRVLNTVYNSLLSNSGFVVNSFNVEINALQAVFDVELKSDDNEDLVKVAVLDAFVDLKVLDENGIEKSSPTLFQNDVLVLTRQGDYQITSLSNAVIEDKWLASHLESIYSNEDKQEQVSANADLMSFEPFKDFAVTFLSNDDRNQLKLDMNEIKSIFEKAESARQQGYMGKAEDYLDQVEDKMKEVFERYEDYEDFNALYQEIAQLIDFHRRNRTRYISGSSYDEYLTAFNKLEILASEDELSYYKALLSQDIEAFLVALNSGDIDSQAISINSYVADLTNTLNLLSSVDVEIKQEILAKITEMSVSLSKSIYLVYSDNLQNNALALSWQNAIVDQLSSDNVYKSDLISAAIADIKAVLIVSQPIDMSEAIYDPTLINSLNSSSDLQINSIAQ